MRKPATKASTAAAAARQARDPATLTRATFVRSRLAEFTSQEGLEKQVGHRADDWLLVIVKELIDNGMDEGERAGRAPVITVTVKADTLTVEDNGGGLKP